MYILLQKKKTISLYVYISLNNKQRVQDFERKNISEKIQNILPKTKTELSRVAAEKACLLAGRGAAKDQLNVDSE